MQLAYDANGNLITDQEGRTLVYDAWNRLVEVKNGGTTLSAHIYDGLSRRNETDGYKLFHSAQWQVIEERNGSNQTTTQYVWSPVYGDALRCRSDGARQRELVLRSIVHNIMIIGARMKGRDRAFASPLVSPQQAKFQRRGSQQMCAT